VSSSASREYVLGCVESLALPRGSIQHFRYLHPYIDEQLRDSLPKTENGELPEALRNLPVVVVYVYQEQISGRWSAEQTKRPDGAYLPVRYGRLLHAFSEGEVAHFYFEIGDYIAAEKEGASARSVLNKTVSFLKGSSEDARRTFAHIGTDINLGCPKAEDASAFQKFVYKLYEPGEWRTRSLGSAPLDVTYDIVFARVAGIFQEVNGNFLELSPVPKSLLGSRYSEYELQTGATYHLKITTHLSSRTPAQLAGQGTAQLGLVYDPDVIKPIGLTSFQIASQYDLEYWSFSVDCHESRHSILTVKCNHEVAVDRENFVRREVLCPEIPLRISITVPPRT
jgi:hypothetical protein